MDHSSSETEVGHDVRLSSQCRWRTFGRNNLWEVAQRRACLHVNEPFLPQYLPFGRNAKASIEQQNSLKSSSSLYWSTKPRSRMWSNVFWHRWKKQHTTFLLAPMTALHALMTASSKSMWMFCGLKTSCRWWHALFIAVNNSLYVSRFFLSRYEYTVGTVVFPRILCIT